MIVQADIEASTHNIRTSIRYGIVKIELTCVLVTLASVVPVMLAKNALETILQVCKCVFSF